MSYLPLKFESSNIFPKEIIAIRPDVHIMVSSGIFFLIIQRDNLAPQPLCLN